MVMMVLGMLFVSCIQPILMIFGLILIVFSYSFYIYMMLGSYWFSYALIMVMMSGVLVVFTYMVSLIPNEGFEMYSLVFLIGVLFLFLFKSYMYYGDDVGVLSLNLWGSYMGFISMFLVSFLFSMMIVVVWVSCYLMGAVRIEWMCAWMKG